MKKCQSHPHGSPELPELADRLRRKSRKVTIPRQAVLKVLRVRRRPLTVKEIYEALSPSPCDLATIYRSINLLERMGMVKRFDLGEGAARFELLAEGDDGHHHHLICTRCSDIVEIEECFPEELQAKIAQRNGYSKVTHRLEFFGVCPRCQ
ncbi:MAG: transcriptional repressor [Verrucomicrobia subdivision 3 bacterium]|nr:transcriptional repressor [Limisphaerales bacterium]